MVSPPLGTLQKKKINNNWGISETKKIQGRLFYHQFSARGGESSGWRDWRGGREGMGASRSLPPLKGTKKSFGNFQRD